MIEFYKYHGTGNDFIMIDNRMKVFNEDKVKFAKKWCDRRFGIGSDGMIFLENIIEADFQMDFYNPDGSQSFCGNGSRCVMAFAEKLGIIGDSAQFMAVDGKHKGNIVDGLYQIQMADVSGLEKIGLDYFIHTGSPHYISYCSEDKEREIVSFGREIRYSPRFKKKGINVNLVKELDQTKIDLRTYERGVENETFACGTGATAAALSLAYKNGVEEGLIDVNMKGGALKVKFKREDDSFTDVWLIGPAEFVYKGEING